MIVLNINADLELMRLIITDITKIDSLMSYNDCFNNFIFLLIVDNSMIKNLTAAKSFINIFLINNYYFHM